MESYADAAAFEALFPDEEPAEESELYAASRLIDRLTFGRIAALGGFAALSEEQRALLSEAVCRQAAFSREGRAAGQWSFASYSINGVTMKAGHGESVRYHSGVAVPGEVESLVEQTGLACRLAGAAL